MMNPANFIQLLPLFCRLASLAGVVQLILGIVFHRTVAQAFHAAFCPEAATCDYPCQSVLIRG